MLDFIKENYFITPIYFLEKKEWVDELNKYSDKYIKAAVDENKKYFNNNKDFGFAHHSKPLSNDDDFNDFKKFICINALNILDEQGYDSSLYSLVISELWVQEFSKEGGGNHNSHIHSNSHISGFYFLKCSDKTSCPVFHEPRLNKKMIQLKEKDEKNVSNASEKITIKPKPGLFIFFNSYLEHEFVVDHGIDPFRFIHFNLQAVPKQLINNDIKRISS